MDLLAFAVSAVGRTSSKSEYNFIPITFINSHITVIIFKKAQIITVLIRVIHLELRVFF